MRIRTTLAAAACAVGIALSFPVSAHAADGPFLYRSATGTTILDSPASGQCIDIPEAADPESMPALAPFNQTHATAVVFENAGCTGQYLVLTPQSAPQNQVVFRSVIFS